jgi:hypothetical protein
MHLVRLGVLALAAWIAAKFLRSHKQEVKNVMCTAQKKAGQLRHRGDTTAATGTHTSAASAGNEPYRDDRDILGGGVAAPTLDARPETMV